MSRPDERVQLENELQAIEAYLAHPITAKILRDNEEQQQSLIRMICDHPITNIETFFAHFEMVGHLRGLRRNKALIQSDLNEIKLRLENL